MLCRRARTRWQVTMARRGAWLRCPWAVAGPGRTTSRRAEPKARGRAAAHGHTKQPGPAGRRPRAHKAARPSGPPPTGTQSSPAQRAAAHQHTQRPGQHERRRGPRNANGTTSNARNPAHTAARPDNAQNTTGTTSTMSRKATTDRHTQQPGPTMPRTPATPQAAPEEQAAPGTPAAPQAPQHISRNRSTSAGAAGTAEFTRPRGGRLRA